MKFEAGTLIKGAYVVINGVEHEVHMPEYEGNTPLTPENLNKMQEDLMKEIKGTVIYENEEGKATSFSLNQTLDDAERIRVHYIGKHSEVVKQLKCVKELDVIDGKVEDTLEAMYSGSINLWIMRTQISISGKAVTLSNNKVNGIGQEIFSREDASIFITKIEIL